MSALDIAYAVPRVVSYTAFSSWISSLRHVTQ
ncbi:hypothetical protein BamIOP4010DRAFT_6561 [Burkholderia ambifaria IOP40-10]|uniref:Uncharacterized protein n=1 Tax=Burkholderia ambifaria IOP40-10 TaxID=396596 RepID=B1FRA0_9BURK|nr:hypothetical protein BamIOP4010DRAFT_6561 [Burkholderia ambifaria IOP40-10]